ncbi:MAG TPA: Asp23/Gls24 family envelope stress response protein [Armatimonadota bacterium]|nr:Asp23/Gls24 family envelope stress response protein [Armatimonadota bacterium]
MSDTAVTELSTELMERSASPNGLRGTTRIADSVVARIAGMAAREVPGVYELSEANFKGAIAGAAQRLAGQDRRDKGVIVEVGQKETIISVNIIVTYEASIPDVAEEIRRNVSDRVNGMTGLHVKEVNIFVSDMHFPTDEAPEAQPRLQ